MKTAVEWAFEQWGTTGHAEKMAAWIRDIQADAYRAGAIAQRQSDMKWIDTLSLSLRTGKALEGFSLVTLPEGER
jgi:hypothetical protein